MAGNILILMVVGLFPWTYLQEARATNVAERPGVCPLNVGMALEACTDLCNVDADCPDPIRKCCKTGCNGMSCKVPNDKPGECPVVREPGTEDCADKKACTSDSECADSLKCCNSSCGKSYCQTPEGQNIDWKKYSGEEYRHAVLHTTMKTEEATIQSGATVP